MERRSYLRSAGVVASVIFAGCSTQRTDPVTSSDEPETTNSEPPTTTTSTATTNNSTSKTQSHETALRNYLLSNNIVIESLKTKPGQNIVLLQYVTEKSGYNELGAEIGMIAGAYFRQIREGWGMQRLDATVFDSSGRPLATWFAKASWFAEFEDGDITGEELSLRVLDTLEPVE